MVLVLFCFFKRESHFRIRKKNTLETQRSHKRFQHYFIGPYSPFTVLVWLGSAGQVTSLYWQRCASQRMAQAPHSFPQDSLLLSFCPCGANGWWERKNTIRADLSGQPVWWFGVLSPLELPKPCFVGWRGSFERVPGLWSSFKRNQPWFHHLSHNPTSWKCIPQGCRVSFLKSQKGVVASHISWFYEIKQAGKEGERKMGGKRRRRK